MKSSGCPFRPHPTIRRFIAPILFLMALPGLPAQSGTTSYPLILQDSYGRTIRLQAEPARIVSIAPNLTETLFALGKGGRLVGRTTFCDYPEEALRVRPIGSITTPDIEAVVSLRPDLVLASTHFSRETLAALERAGLTVAVMYGPESFEGVYEVIRKIAVMVNASGRAEEIVAGMEATVREVTATVRGAVRPSVYYAISYGEFGDYTAGGNTFIGRMIEMAGGRNIAADLSGWAYSLEKIVERNPSLVVCSTYFDMEKGLSSAPGYRDLPAIRQGRLYAIDTTMIDRQGPRLAEGLLVLARIFHPDLFR